MNIKKIGFYFKPINNYFSYNSRFSPENGNWEYPLSLINHIQGPLYQKFNDEGIPIRISGKDEFYFYSHIASWALGNWELYMISNNPQYKDNLIKISDFTLRLGKWDGDSLSLMSQKPGKYFGSHSAMDQGLAISVLTRAYLSTGNEKYLRAAKDSLKLFYKELGEGGVKNIINRNNKIWFEEDTVSKKRHILNGMIYAMFGLYDLVKWGDENAKELWNIGLDSIKSSLPLFDTGSWSWYWIDDEGNNYIASMLYHSLHIHMIRALLVITEDEIFKKFWIKFFKYSQSNINRIKAGLRIAYQKMVIEF